MRKIFIFLLAFAVLPSALCAQSAQKRNESAKAASAAYLGKEGKSVAFGDQIERLFAQKALEQARLDNLQDFADQQDKKAIDALDALTRAYPEHKAVLLQITDGYQEIVHIAFDQTDAAAAQKELNEAFFLLFKDLRLLHRQNEDLLKQVSVIFNHEYWLNGQKKLVSWTALKEFAGIHKRPLLKK